jgi:translation initiation factor 1 (eIF-1/SUI1)
MKNKNVTASKNVTTAIEIVPVVLKAKPVAFLGKEVAKFVLLSDKTSALRESVTAMLKNYTSEGGSVKALRKEVISAGVDRRRVSEVLLSLGVKDENHDARSKASKSGKGKAKAPSAKNVDASLAVIDFLKGKAKAKKDQEEILELALKAIRSAK